MKHKRDEAPILAAIQMMLENMLREIKQAKNITYYTIPLYEMLRISKYVKMKSSLD